jgi:hypothetical protein
MEQDKLSRNDLIALVNELRDPSSRGRRGPLVRRLEAQLPGTDVLNLCHSDLPSDTIVDLCLGMERTKRTLNREELLELVEALRSRRAVSETEELLMIETFAHNCRHPAGTDLVYYPDTVFGQGTEVTAEMIVDKALAGK